MPLKPALLQLLPKEVQILLLTAGGSGTDAELKRLLGGEVAWGELLVALEWERAVPVAWWRLKQLGASASTPGGAALERLSRVTEFRAMALEDRLRRTLAGLQEAGIPVILLKGAGMALTVYSSFTERPMGDIDLLVSPHHARRAWDMALAQGWVWDDYTYPEGHYQAHHHLPPLFDGARTGARLELHTALSLSSHPFAMSFEDAQAVSRVVPGWEDGRTRVLDTEHTLIHIAVHFAWAHLASFGIWRLARDLDALSRSGIDWGRAVEVATRYRAEPALFWSLSLASALSGVDVAPAGVLAELAPRRAPWMLNMLERHMAMHVVSRVTPCPSEKLRRLMWSLALSPARTATSDARPWDSEPSRLPAVYSGEMGLLNRIRSQWSHARDWRRYLGALGGRATA
ncbi:MAG: nucleotidyltransferase family protein [Gemmatimonadetes bacterium]|nr:nucleotidyltransferase family protein [Gemmatimonadota bacterium]